MTIWLENQFILRDLNERVGNDQSARFNESEIQRKLEEKYAICDRPRRRL